MKATRIAALVMAALCAAASLPAAPSPAAPSPTAPSPAAPRSAAPSAPPSATASPAAPRSAAPSSNDPTRAESRLLADPQLNSHQRVVAVTVALLMLGVVLELVRRRKLREEYSLVWIGTAAALLALALEPRLLSLFERAIGAKEPTSALFFGALVFLMAVSLLVSVRLSRVAFRNKALARQTALVQQELSELRAELAGLRRDLAALRGGSVRKDGAA